MNIIMSVVISDVSRVYFGVPLALQGVFFFRFLVLCVACVLQIFPEDQKYFQYK